jgi:restriction endonuclease Mrr
MKAFVFGGWGDAAGRLTSPGADEGIDGLIHEDRLGLDTINLPGLGKVLLDFSQA